MPSHNQHISDTTMNMIGHCRRAEAVSGTKGRAFECLRARHVLESGYGMSCHAAAYETLSPFRTENHCPAIFCRGALSVQRACQEKAVSRGPNADRTRSYILQRN